MLLHIYWFPIDLFYTSTTLNSTDGWTSVLVFIYSILNITIIAQPAGTSIFSFMLGIYFYILVFYVEVCMFYILFFYSAETPSGITTTRPLTLLGSNLLPAHHSVPSAPSNLEAVITSTRFITLSWDQPTSNNLHITGYSVYYQQEGSER